MDIPAALVLANRERKAAANQACQTPAATIADLAKVRIDGQWRIIIRS